MTSQPGSNSHFALVLPGAIARGAYEAGVIDELVRQGLKIDRIVATSSGALNGLALAAGIRCGHLSEMVENLIKAWVDEGSWNGALKLSPWSLLMGRGLSSRESLLTLMRSLVKPCHSAHRYPVELRVILTPLNGVIGHIGGRPATTYEKILKFSDEDFDSQEKLDEIYEAVAAACAFPGLFEPVQIDGLGACVDGGAVNNAPIKYALEESGVNRVIVPVPFPAVMAPGDLKKGFSLLNHLIEILINERLYRDLKDAHTVNHKADRLDDLARTGVLSEDQVLRVKDAMQIRNVEITQVRPRVAFTSSPFAGFFNKSERMKLIDEGREAAREMLSQIPSENPTGVQTTV